MKQNEYECAMCHEVFAKTWSDAEALEEMEGYFGSVPKDERVMVCDDCFNQIHPAEHPKEVEAARQELKKASDCN